MTVAENMAFSLRLPRAPRAERDEKVRKAARILRLEPLLDRRPSQLSGGQKQRVAIGRTIVRELRVFLFDEPLSNLDAELRVQMRSELAELHQRLGITMNYVTHDQVEAMTLADKMVVMNGGVVQQQGRPLDLYDDPANTFVAGFVRTPRMNFLRGRVSRSSDEGLTLSVLGGTAGEVVVPSTGRLPVGTEVQVGIRPEHLHLNPQNSPAALPVRIGLVEELGSISLCHGRLPDSQPVTVQLNGRFQGSSDLIHVAPEPNCICLFDAQGDRVHV
jgi:lactose/L-arabinose transport system ATP-binding protein